MYNLNIEAENFFETDRDAKQVCAGDFGLLFNVRLESYGGNPVFLSRSVGKTFELKETYNLTGISRIRSPKAKQYTFRQKHMPWFIQRRRHFFISNNIQEFIVHTEIIPAIFRYSPILTSLFKEKENNKGSGFWKFNTLLLSENILEEKLQQHIHNIKNGNKHSNDPQIKWEFFKY